MPYPKNYNGNCCTGCGNPATRWIDVEKYGKRRFVSWPYCDEHGEWLLNGPGTATRPLKRQR